jgi:magnesium chelatase accessory protein
VTAALDWARDGPLWPHAEASRRVVAGDLTWHVQTLGQGPALVLLHGTGASTHSWGGGVPQTPSGRDLPPILASRYTVVMPDLPGHGFTSQPRASGLTLPAMARSIADLLAVLDIKPALAIGHSAGCAIALEMIRAKLIAPSGVIGLNAALLPFGGIAGVVFQPMARLLTLNPFIANILAGQASPRRVSDTIAGTGSVLDPKGLSYYERLFATPAHVQSALQMMAGWNLAPLVQAFPDISTPVVLIVTGGDRAVPPDQGRIASETLANARVAYLKNLGHLAHEEAPLDISAKLLEIAAPWSHPNP